MLVLTRSAYYRWLNNPNSARDQKDRELTILIKEAAFKGRNTYGSRRIKAKLAQLGKTISCVRVIRLMREANIEYKTKRKFKITTKSSLKKEIAPNLLMQDFTVREPDSCWVGDITYIPTNEGWLYLATVIDLYSRRVVGWSMSRSIKSALVNDALTMAIFRA